MITYPEIDPVALSLGPIQIHWYGLMYLLGFTLCGLVAVYRTRQPWSPLQKHHIEDVIFYMAIGVIVGGRLGYCLFYGLDSWLQDPLWVFKIWTGGMSFHGGALGLTASVILFAKKINKPGFAVLDFVVVKTPLGLFVGRIGNFIGQELWGRETDVPWAMVFPNDPLGIARHPSQLYEAILEGLVLFVILYWYSMKPRPRGAISGLFLIGYGIFRAFVEIFREPDNHIGFDILGVITRGQLLCIPMIVIGLVIMINAYRNNKTAA